MAPCPAKIPGLERRRQTFYLTIVRPADLRGDSRSRYDFRGSLQTRDEAQARIKALELRAQAEARWEAQRASRRPQPTIPATAALADMLATKLRHEFLESDDTNRMAGKPLEHLPFLPEGMRSPQGSGFAAVEATQANIAAHAAALQWCLGAGQLEPFIQLLAYALEGTGLPPIDWDTDPTPFLRFARGMVSLFCDIEARAHGEPIETPAPTVPPSASPVPVLVQPPTAAVTTWEELQEDWQAAAKRTTTAIKITARSIREFAEVCPGVLPAQVTRGHAAKLRASLVAKGLKGKSVRNLIGPLVALLNLAVDSDKLATNPWRGIRVDTADSTKRLPWRLEQLAALAAVNNTREDPGRWLLPLLLYTGCRLGAILFRY